MANTQSERTLKMKQNFIRLHGQGLDVKDIAEAYDLSTKTVYNSLDKIATKAGVSRESLLQKPHKVHNSHAQDYPRAVTPINLIDHQNYVTETLKNFELTIANVDAYIITQEAIQEEEETKS